MKELYNAKLVELNEINENLQTKIKVINEMNDPDKFTFNEMNSFGFIKRLAKIEQEPILLWDAVNKVYGDGYFTKIIEKEYGVNTNTFVSLNDRVSKRVNDFKLRSEAEIGKK